MFGEKRVAPARALNLIAASWQALVLQRFVLVVAVIAANPGGAGAGFNGMAQYPGYAGAVTVVAPAPGQPDRLYVGTREGLIRTLDLTTGAYSEAPFLTIPEIELALPAGDGGLLGLAFHPDFQANGKFYVTVTVDNGGAPVAGGVTSPFSAQVREYTVAPDHTVDPGDFVTIIEWVKPQNDHTGGWIGFSPVNGYLHVATGDGGGGYDYLPGHTSDIGNAQDLTDNWMGKVLRIDVSADAFPADPTRNYAVPSTNPYVGREGDNEIFASGLRSPWRASFDHATGDLWIGDVGEDVHEEVDLIPATSQGGENFGWRLREGFIPTPAEGIGGYPPPGNVFPAYDYVHAGLGGNPNFEGNSVTGGYVYRGPDPTLQGKYVFADFIAAQFWMFDTANPYGSVTNITSMLLPDSGNASLITTFAEDAIGNLYVGTLFGDVFRLFTDSVLPGDFQADGLVDVNDHMIWSANFGDVGEKGEYLGDADDDGAVSGFDFLAWQQNFGHNPVLLTEARQSSQPVPEHRGAFLMAASLLGLAALRQCRTVRPQSLRIS